MEPARSLREVFAELIHDENARNAYAADPDGFLAAYGHAGLPAGDIDEAIVNFAETASPAVAEHLATFVMAHSAVPVDAAADAGPGTGLDLLAAAPREFDTGDVAADLDAEVTDSPIDAQALGFSHEVAVDLDFGSGTEQSHAVVPEHPEAVSFATDAVLEPDAAVDAVEPTGEGLLDRLDLPSSGEPEGDGDAFD
jgi:hypothetical protein